MNTRREFLRTLAVGTAALAFAPRLLSSPPKTKTLWDWIEGLSPDAGFKQWPNVCLGAEALAWCQKKGGEQLFSPSDWAARGYGQGVMQHGPNALFVYEPVPLRCLYYEKNSPVWILPWVNWQPVPGELSARCSVRNPCWENGKFELAVTYRGHCAREGCIFERSTFETVQIVTPPNRNFIYNG